MASGIRYALLLITLGSSLLCRVFAQNDLPVDFDIDNPEDVVAIKWEELMSAADLEAILNAPPVSHSGFGWEDQFNDGDQDAFNKALKSFDVNPDLIGKRILLPGFIVPTAYNEDRKVTEFFLVPFFGACIHVPPPPPNQIIHVTYEDGLELQNLYEAFYILGELNAQVVRHDLADSAYTMNAEHIEMYTY
jgi:hypothetical protein